MSLEPTVRVHGVCHGAQRRVLERVEFELSPGEGLAITGGVGSGKSTLAQILVTLVAPHRGHVSICGYDSVAQPAAVRRVLGYLPQRAGVYRHLSLREHLEFFARVYERPAAAVDGALELLDLKGAAHALATEVPKEQQQLLHVARLLIHDPPVLLLDEPLRPLQSRGRQTLATLMKELLDLGKAMIVLGQQTAELDALCQRQLRLDRGLLQPRETARPATSEAAPPPTPTPSATEPPCWLQLRVSGDSRDLVQLLSGLQSVRGVEVRGEWLHVTHVGGPATTSELIATVVRHGFTPIALNASAERPSLPSSEKNP